RDDDGGCREAGAVRQLSRANRELRGLERDHDVRCDENGVDGAASADGGGNAGVGRQGQSGDIRYRHLWPGAGVDPAGGVLSRVARQFEAGCVSRRHLRASAVSALGAEQRTGTPRLVGHGGAFVFGEFRSAKRFPGSTRRWLCPTSAGENEAEVRTAMRTMLALVL